MQTRQLYQLNGDHALSAELRQKGYREWGIPLLLREPEAVRQFVARYPGAVAVDGDGTYGEQLRFKSPSGKIELYSEELEALLLATVFRAPAILPSKATMNSILFREKLRCIPTARRNMYHC